MQGWNCNFGWKKLTVLDEGLLKRVRSYRVFHRKKNMIDDCFDNGGDRFDKSDCIKHNLHNFMCLTSRCVFISIISWITCMSLLIQHLPQGAADPSQCGVLSRTHQREAGDQPWNLQSFFSNSTALSLHVSSRELFFHCKCYVLHSILTILILHAFYLFISYT